MVIKKTELYASLWASCDQLRGGMDASQYKNYILTLLFVKYVSEKYANQKLGAIVYFATLQFWVLWRLHFCQEQDAETGA